MIFRASLDLRGLVGLTAPDRSPCTAGGGWPLLAETAETMKALVSGEVVELDRNEWNFNGKTGVAYAIYVRTASARDSAQRVKVSAEQYGSYAVGDEVGLPVDIFANLGDNGTARLRVTLEPDFVYARTAHSASYASSSALDI